MKYVIFLSLLVILILLIWIGKDINKDLIKKKTKKQGGIMCTEVEQLPIDLKSLDDSLSRYFNNLDTEESGDNNDNNDNNRNVLSDLIVKSKLLKTDDQRFEAIFKIDKHLLHNVKPIYLVTYYPQGNTIFIYDETGNEVGTQRTVEDDSGQFDYKKNSTYIGTIYDVTKPTDDDRVVKSILKQNRDVKDITKYKYNNDVYYLASSLEEQFVSSVFNSSGRFFKELSSPTVIEDMESDRGKFSTDWNEKAIPIIKIYQNS